MRFGNKTSYYKVVANRQSYLGDKYFAMGSDSDTVLQVCVNPGPDVRRGRTNAVGVYTVTRMTFASNYIAMGYVEPISKNQYKKVFNKMLAALKEAVA